MFSKILIQFLCLSLALIQIKAMVKLPANENEVTNEEREPEPNEEPERRHRHHHHHHRHHNNDRGDMPSAPPQPNGPPHHEMMAQLWPLLKTLLNKEYHKNGGFSATDDSKMATNLKARAFLTSKTKTIYTETQIDNNKNTNESKVLSKTLEQNGETDAIIDFNSDMGVVSDKVVKAKEVEESKPIQAQPGPEMSRMENKRMVYPVRNLRRMKRDDGEEGKKTWGKIMDGFKQVGKAIEEGYKEHVEKPIKKFADNVKNKVEDWKKKQQEKKAAKNKDNGDTQEVAEEAHGEK